MRIRVVIDGESRVPFFLCVSERSGIPSAGNVLTINGPAVRYRVVAVEWPCSYSAGSDTFYGKSPQIAGSFDIVVPILYVRTMSSREPLAAGQEY